MSERTGDHARYDCVILSTGLVESIVAAALAVAGKSVLQIDENDHYGSSWSTVSPDRVPGARLVRSSPSSQSCDVFSSAVSFDLNPRLAYADGPLISMLLASGAHHYAEFVFAKVLVWSEKTRAFLSVAASKGDVFKDESLTLAQKNTLMRALRDLAEHPERPWRDVFRADPELADRFVHGVCLCSDENSESAEKNAHSLLTMYGRSSGKYAGLGSSPFLYPKYGGEEICSAFSRRAAVAGAVQMLRCEARVEGEGIGFSLRLRDDDGTERSVSASTVICGRRTRRVRRCCAVVRGQLIAEHGRCLVAFPRASSSGGVIWMLQLDQASGCCNMEGHSAVQLWTDDTSSPALSSPALSSPALSSPVDEFRDILEEHFDCSEAFGGPARDDKPCIKALWACHGVSEREESPGALPDGVITFDADLAADGLVSYVGLAAEAERIFRLAWKDPSAPAAFPFAAEHAAGEEPDDEDLDALAHLLE